MYLDDALSRKERKFLAEVAKFVKLDFQNKFDPGTRTRRWFAKRYNLIKQSNNIICRQAVEQYEEYASKYPKFKFTGEELLTQLGEDTIHNNYFDSKLKEFMEETCFDKFNKKSIITFSDGTKMGNWFSSYRELIFSMNTKEAIGVKQQFLDYCKNASADPSVVFNDGDINSRRDLAVKMREFCRILDLKKFSEESSIQFKDGTLVSTWISENLNHIRTLKSDTAIKISKQYATYCANLLDERLKEKNKNVFGK